MAKTPTKADLQARITALESELAAYQVRERPSRHWPIGHSPVQAAQLAQRTLPPGFHAARELAMRTGKSVRVVTN